ncbi:MAG: aspartate/glutamate racemase family protein [Chitinophagales bacterium]|nr:aspartate/glutamate racemase family protein [Chitinophagales bacterium]
MKKVGLVGGISWTSTQDYYRYINEGINQKLGGLNFAECMIYSLNFGDIQKRGWEHALESLLNACKSLKNSGAEAIVLCANTAHLYADQIEKEIGLPIISIIVETARTVTEYGLKRVGLLGTVFTMEKDFYRKKLEEKGLTVLVPELQEEKDTINYILKEELGRGIIRNKSKEAFITIANNLIKRGAEGIILGCTEIPLIIHQEDITVPVFDTTKIHSDAIIDFAIS